MIVSGSAPKRIVWTERTLVEQLAVTVAAHGERTATIDGESRRTWSELQARSRQIARGLLAASLRRGDHIGLFLPNCADFLSLWLAAAHVGAVAVPFNTRYGAFELEHILHDSDVRFLFLVDGFLSVDATELFDTVDPLSRPEEFPKLEQIYSLSGTSRWPTLDALIDLGSSISEESLDRAVAEVEPTDPTIVVYTSGSTGKAKGVVHSHNALRNECAIAEWLAVDEESVILGHMPFFHVAGGLSALLPPVLTGASIVFVDHWDPTTALELIERHRISAFGGIATHYIDLVSHPDLANYDLSSLRTGWMGGSMNPRELIESVQKSLPCKVFPVYGMTETTSATTYPRWDDPPEIFLSGKGFPISDFELKVVDVDTGEELDADQSGEVCVRGHLLMLGYYKLPEATAAVIDAEEWFHTGDVGRLDPSGHLAIVGRSKDMFIVGGNNVFPAEIEAALVAFSEVQHAQVVSIPDERLGEVGFAFIQPRSTSTPSEAELVEWSKQRLAGFKVPRHWDFVEDWPRLDNGKIDRIALQQRAVDSLDLDELAERRLLRDDGSGGR